ncbi:MAG: redoxin family protein [Myxococcota bacterium]
MSGSSQPEAKAEAKAPSRWKRWLRDALILAVIFVGVRTWQRRDLPSGPAPALVTASIDGERVALAEGDGPTLVHFWATWCGVCKAMDHNIVALAEDHRVITVAVQSGPAGSVLSWMRDEGLWQDDTPAFPTVADPRSGLAQRWGVSAFPTSFVISDEGEIEYVEVGYTSEAGLRTRMWLAE